LIERIFFARRTFLTFRAAERGQAASQAANRGQPHAAWRAIQSSTTGAMRSRHLLPLKMP
jgi:hypothetical protein